MKSKNRLKKILIYLLSVVFIIVSNAYLYVVFPKSLESFDNRLRDYMFIIRGILPHNDNVVIVDIDEKSLKEVGQWPWSRDVLATMLENMTKAGVAVIGFDMVFAEEDRTSPHKIFKKFHVKKENIPNYDEIFANTVGNTPTILGYQFQLDKKSFMQTKAPQIPAVFIEKNRNIKDEFVLNAQGTILNIPLVQDNSYSSGFFNNVPDPSGIIRSVPLIIRYDDQLYPSLAFELIRAALGVNRVFVNYGEMGVQSITLGDIEIPTDMFGRVIVNYRGPEKTFKYIPAVDIYNNNFDKSDIEGKVVLIGTSAAGLFDLRAMPFEAVYPGVEVHANVIDNILTGDFLYKPSWVDGANILHIVLLSVVVFFIIMNINIYLIPFVVLGILFSDAYVVYYSLFHDGIILNIFFPLITIAIASSTAILINYLFEMRQSNMIKGKFASKVSAKVMEDLLKNEENNLQGESKEVTVFFSDVRGFTNISEAMPNAKALIDYLNEYMEPMTNIIMKNEGTVDKFIGDAIMAYWNAPSDVPNHQDKAVIASLQQLEHLSVLNEKLKKENKPLIDIGIGLNSGVAIVGEMGSSGRSDYTVIGDPINLGARLESLCKFYNSRLNISSYTKEKLQGEYIYRFLDLVTVKGKAKPVEIWQVLGFGEAQGALKEELELYHEAIKLYKASHFVKALELFEKCENNENKTNMNIYKIYIERCEHYIQTPPKDFDGVFVHTTKG
ncbi:MAG: CHASE2 domain-containing protein [Candidatus Marinarcus sp.]|uniref:CHASE2 domain-containing protein n=1 Tax=Candidatus Marinarcus sp. TaxID=3100987 RepID=UPI003B0086AC